MCSSVLTSTSQSGIHARVCSLTDNHPDFTAAIFIIAGDHGGYCVVHHGNHIHLEVLGDNTRPGMNKIQSSC